ncbi:uncharacterized protein LOC143560396 [Bidens hawaiensis]|uniref:uncharacterized protein LOC143560396 n=1 Tax=Bidens hawaiensis TaxID=980011 RepID=UPI004048ECB5
MPPKWDNVSSDVNQSDPMLSIAEKLDQLLNQNTASAAASAQATAAHQAATAQTNTQLQALTTAMQQQIEISNQLLNLLHPAQEHFHVEQPLPNNDNRLRHPHIHLPFFDGSNPLDCWYKHLSNNKLLGTWPEFTSALSLRFGPSEYENHQAALFKLRQITTVHAYQAEFEQLSNYVFGLPPQALLDCFISGLRHDIQTEIAIHKPRTLHQAYGLAKLIKDKIAATPKTRYASYNRPTYPSNTSTLTATPQQTTTMPTPATASTSSAATKPGLLPTPTKPTTNLPFNKLTPDELQKCRSEGLCFRCPEKYFPGHKCNPPQFLLIVDNDDGFEDEPEAARNPPDITQRTDPPEFLSLSNAAFFGLISPRTLRLTGKIHGHQVTVLVDSGSTHNIIQPRIASLLQLPTDPIKPFMVMVGNGQHIACKSYCPQVPLILNLLTFEVPFYVLPVEGADIVLGVEWLSTLGPIVADFAVPKLSFTIKGSECVLTGEQFNGMVTPSTLHCLVLKQRVDSLHTLVFENTQPQPKPTPKPTHDNSQINQLLQTYNSLFDEPTSLPPNRKHDHHIPTIEGTKPVNVKPYRYPHFQKQIMTDLITEMLQTGVIQPSHSLYSSPVLLVHKRDGSWRFCVDYRALNAITIRDRFPIPTVDELLDELHGATVFSKIDLRAGYHQIRVASDDVGKTAFRTIDGHYEFLVMPFGLTNAPSTFQAAMNDLFRQVLRKFVLVFFDDILVYSTSWDLHFQHLDHWGRTVTTRPTDFFFSKKLCPRMQAQSAYNRELYAITEAVKKWRQYLLGRKFRIFTDHHSLRHLLTQTINTPDQQKWISKLLGFDFELHFKPGKENKVADALSRLHGDILLTLSVPVAKWLDDLRLHYSTDSEATTLLDKIIKNPTSLPQHTIRGGVVYIRGKLLIPPLPTLRRKLLDEFHSSTLGGHSGINATYKRMIPLFVWSNLKNDITDFIRHCHTCQTTKGPNHRPYGLLQPLAIPSNIWEDISMDFITQLPASQGKTAIWVIVDRLSKFSGFIPLPPTFNAASLASLFLKEFYKLHGLPKTIISDRDPIFLSRFWKQPFKQLGTKLLHSSAYHPQTDGQTEVVNRCLEAYLRSFVHHDPKTWSRFLYLAEFWYNTSFHSSINMTPFCAVYGRDATAIHDYNDNAVPTASTDSSLIEHKKIIAKLKYFLDHPQQAMVRQANQHRLHKEFQPGDWVYLRLQKYRQASVDRRLHHKLSKRFFGPYQVEEKIGSDEPPHDELTSDSATSYVPESVLNKHTSPEGHSELLIKWQAKDITEATWEDVDEFQLQFPTFPWTSRTRSFLGKGVMIRITMQDLKPKLLVNPIGSPKDPRRFLSVYLIEKIECFACKSSN